MHRKRGLRFSSLTTALVVAAAMVAVVFVGIAPSRANIALSGSEAQVSATTTSSTTPTTPATKAAAAKAAKLKAAKLKAAKLKAAKLKAAKLKAAKLKAAQLKAAKARAAAAALAHARWLAEHGISPTLPATPPVDSSPADPSTAPSASPVGFPIIVPSTTPVTVTPPAPPTAAPTVAPATSAPSPTAAPTTSAPTPSAPTPSAPTPSDTPSTVPLRPGGQPGPSNTGVPAGTALTVFNGDLTINTPGATYTNLDVHGYVRVNAPNVTIKNSIIRGGSGAPGNGIVNDTSLSATNFLIEDSELVPDFPSTGLDCIKGFNYTALRVNMHGTVDGAKMYGPNATVQNSWIHGLVTYAHDPAQNGGQSHNDGVQVLSGSNLRIIGNTIEGGSNTGIQVTQDHGIVTSLTINGNWMSGGACTVNLANKPLATLVGITMNDNIFTNDSALSCTILYTPVTALSASGNVFINTGLPIKMNGNGAA